MGKYGNTLFERRFLAGIILLKKWWIFQQATFDTRRVKMKLDKPRQGSSGLQCGATK